MSKDASRGFKIRGVLGDRRSAVADIDLQTLSRFVHLKNLEDIDPELYAATMPWRGELMDHSIIAEFDSLSSVQEFLTESETKEQLFSRVAEVFESHINNIAKLHPQDWADAAYNRFAPDSARLLHIACRKYEQLLCRG